MISIFFMIMIMIKISKIKTDLPTSAMPILPTLHTESDIFAPSSLVIPGAVANLMKNYRK